MKPAALVLSTVANPKAGPELGEDRESSQNHRFYLSGTVRAPNPIKGPGELELVMAANGTSAFPEAFTFDDVLLKPGLSDVLPSEVDIRTRITRSIALNLPIVASAMDTVT